VQRVFAFVFAMMALVAGCRGKPSVPGVTVGKVTAVHGVVTMRRGDLAPVPVEPGLLVARDMIFVTADDASLEVRFDNNYVWKLPGGRERAVAGLQVIDLPRIQTLQSIADEPAVRAAEQAAARDAAIEADAAVPSAPPSPEVDPPMKPEVPVLTP
jgi:hypothetical protein